jgi:hypothetical protein
LFEQKRLNRKTGRHQGSQELMFAISQGLQPLQVAYRHNQGTAPKGHGAAMGSKLGAGNARPALPKASQLAFVAPILL